MNNPLHPFTVHFPIALLLMSGLFTFIHLRRNLPQLETSAYHCLIAGWIGAAVAVVSGVIDAVRQFVGPEAARDPAVLVWVNGHAALGIATLIVYGNLLLQRRRNPNLLANPATRRRYLTNHIIGAILLLLSGWLGGHLVYQLGLGRFA